MPEYNWPEPSKRRHIGNRTSRLDGPDKTTGHATYSYDVNRPGMLFAKILTCPHAHAKITKLDVSAAKSMAGVKSVRITQDVGTEIQWELDEIVAVAATSEEVADDAIRAIQIEYELLPHFVTEEHKDKAPSSEVAKEESTGDPDAAALITLLVTSVAAQIVITLHVQGGGEGELAYARSQVAGFGTCADAKVDFETWKIYALMMPGVDPTPRFMHRLVCGERQK